MTNLDQRLIGTGLNATGINSKIFMTTRSTGLPDARQIGRQSQIPVIGCHLHRQVQRGALR